MIDGIAEISGQSLQKRDAIGLWDQSSFEISAEKGSKILLMEVPMQI